MEIKKLGFGGMRFPVLDGDMTRVDHAQLCRMFDLFLERGFTYFDTSVYYHDGNSETAVRRALVERHPRDSFVLADKLPIPLIHDDAEMRERFARQLEDCGVEYFDYYMLHMVTKENSADQVRSCDMFGFLRELKEQGKVRHIGFSFHDTAEALEEILAEPHEDVDFVQIVINYLDWNHNAIQSKKCYDVIRKYGKQVVVMETVKGGTLAELRPEAHRLLHDAEPEMSDASWAVRYAAGLDGVLVALSGMSDLAQTEDNTSYMRNFVPLDREEHALLDRVVGIYDADRAIDCVDCGKCDGVCPRHIKISEWLTYYNELMQERDIRFNAVLNYFRPLSLRGGSYGDCIECGKCGEVCPRKLNVSAELKKSGDFYDSMGW